MTETCFAKRCHILLLANPPSINTIPEPWRARTMTNWGVTRQNRLKKCRLEDGTWRDWRNKCLSTIGSPIKIRHDLLHARTLGAAPQSSHDWCILETKLELLETSAANNEFAHVKRAEDVKAELKWTNSFLATKWRQPKKPDSSLDREVH